MISKELEHATSVARAEPYNSSRWVGVAEMVAGQRCTTRYGMSRPYVLAGPDGSEAGETRVRAN
jgi:hypothetical protein